MTTSPEERRFEKTRSLKSIIDDSTQKTLDKFGAWPILEIRQVCLERMKSFSWPDKGVSDWAEKHIQSMLEINDQLL